MLLGEQILEEEYFGISLVKKTTPIFTPRVPNNPSEGPGWDTYLYIYVCMYLNVIKIYCRRMNIYLHN